MLCGMFPGYGIAPDEESEKTQRMKLNEVTSPERLKQCTPDELEALAGEIREKIIATVAVNGGHLASSLGVVELTLALHRAFDCPRDKIIFDVGHQCYAHKMLTGRAASFSTLRQQDGISGFPCRAESEYDAFGAGHASTAISAAVGMARARDMRGEDYRVVAVVGDGALTGGMCYEALNEIGSLKTPLIVVLNDNGMSISRNVGALSKQLTRLRISRGWLGTKLALTRALENTPFGGDTVLQGFRRIKNNLRGMVVREHFFTGMGFRYLGPIDGYDIAGMEQVFQKVRQMKEPVVVHVVTKKGHGFPDAEEHPEKYHSVPPAYTKLTAEKPVVMGSAAGNYLSELAGRDDRVCAITAAMTPGVGLKEFRKEHRDHFFDVGIAEEHAVTMAAGMAAVGMRPFVMIYDTFLQRGVDQIIEDVCLQRLPVCFLMDRAGLGGEDGATHHGVFSIPLLRCVPNLTFLCPRNAEDLKACIDYSLKQDGPVAIRYARCAAREEAGKRLVPGQWQTLLPGKDAALLTFSALTDEALKASRILQKQGVSLEVIDASCIKPLDEKVLLRLQSGGVPFLTAEESVLAGGFGSAVQELCAEKGWRLPAKTLGIRDQFVMHGERSGLLKAQGLDADALARAVLEALGR